VRKHVFLIGFMGAGKTSVGRGLAVRLAIPFVDLDTVVEERDGRTIAEIFRGCREPGVHEEYWDGGVP